MRRVRKERIIDILLLLFILSAIYIVVKTDTVVNIEISEFNSSALLIKYDENIENLNPPKVSFSNSNEYITILNQDPLEYVVNFPIYWDPYSPYATYSSGTGFVENEFLFYTHKLKHYELNFHNSTKIISSDHQESNKLKYLNQDLTKSFIIFGNFTSHKTRVGKTSFQIIGTKNTNISSKIIDIINYYYETFDNPVSMQSRYTIGIGLPKTYSSRETGFSGMNEDIRYFSHELFHSWQPKKSNCHNELLFNEGLASYMQWYAPYKTGMITKEQFENEFSIMLENLSEIPNIEEKYNLSDHELIELRETNPSEYQYLVYYKGGLIFKKANETTSITDVFNNFLSSNNCSEINKIIEINGKKLYEEILNS